MDRVDTIVAGAGVIGLAIARRCSEKKGDTVVLERHESFGKETSSRNSEVVHAGLYYHEDLLKTSLCVRGNPLLYELCEAHGIPFRRFGKIVVAASRDEEELIDALYAQAEKNGAVGIRIIGREEIADLEPAAFGTRGLYSPSSGIVDSHALMASFERTARANGATVAYGCEITGVERDGAGYRVEFTDTDGQTEEMGCDVFINSAGLFADGIASMAGFDVDALGYRIRPCKGEYFKVSDRHRGKIGRLVYPVPTPVYLGAHAALAMDGSFKIGPGALYVDEIEYSVDPSHGREFFEKAVRFLPFLEPGDLTPDMCGIRPKLYRKGEPMRDFIIREESGNGFPGFVNLIGMESPGLTSCLSIAEYVAKLL